MGFDIPTTKISDGHGGFITINESDFDEKVHKRYAEEKTTEESTDESRTKAELIEDAESKGLNVTSSMTKADIGDLLDLASKSKQELAELAEAKGIDVKGMTKAEIVDALKADGGT